MGREVTAEIEHRKGDGTLIYKSKTIPEPDLPEAPEPPTEPGFRAKLKYIKQVFMWQMKCVLLMDNFNAIMKYEELRAHYAGANRNKDMPTKYRTGEPYPKTRVDARREINILKKLIKEE